MILTGMVANHLLLTELSSLVLYIDLDTLAESSDDAENIIQLIQKLTHD